MDPNPDALEALEEEYGTRGSRGILGGKAAKRKDNAYLRYQENCLFETAAKKLQRLGAELKKARAETRESRPFQDEQEGHEDEEPWTMIQLFEPLLPTNILESWLATS